MSGDRSEADALRQQLDQLDRLAISPGLCANCRHLRLQAGRSVFVRCGLADDDAAFPRYPRLPVMSCNGYRPAEKNPSG